MNQTVNKTELLSKEDELSLIKAAQGGCQKARSMLMSKNQGLVHKIVKSFPLKNTQVGYDDLWQQGCMGFLHAVDLFDINQGVRLSTYAYRWIHAYIRRYYQNQGRVVRIPAHLADKKFQLDREVQSLTQRLGYVPSQEELEEFVPGYTKLANTFAYTVSLNHEMESGEEVLDLQSDTVSPDDRLQVDSLLSLLKDEVSKRDYNIFVRRYGVDGNLEHTLDEVAGEFSLTRARIHQVVNHCLSVVRAKAD
jgi:RNA polymerase sigma factor (sigma-70 family)